MKNFMVAGLVLLESLYWFQTSSNSHAKVVPRQRLDNDCSLVDMCDFQNAHIWHVSKVIVYKSCSELSLLVQFITCSFWSPQSCNLKKSKVRYAKPFLFCFYKSKINATQNSTGSPQMVRFCTHRETHYWKTVLTED